MDKDQYKKLTQQLNRCGLSWHHARTTIFIQKVSNRYLQLTPFTPESLPQKAAKHLEAILDNYEAINEHLRRIQSNWDDPLIKSYFRQHAKNNQLTLAQWQELKNYLFEYIAF